MKIVKKIKELLAGQPANPRIDFTHLSKQKKVELLEREAGVFVNKYGEVIKKLAHE